MDRIIFNSKHLDICKFDDYKYQIMRDYKSFSYLGYYLHLLLLRFGRYMFVIKMKGERK